MLKKDLAEALGISGAMVSKLAARGMPTHSIAAARHWRAANLSQGHTKQFRAPPVPRTVDPVAIADRLNHELRDNLEAAPEVRQALAAKLRAAMRAIPVGRLCELRLFLGCWEQLLGRFPTLFEIDGEEFVDNDHPWYEIAAELAPMPQEHAAGPAEAGQC